jgi:CRP/FNR family transcriptional regulator
MDDFFPASHPLILPDEAHEPSLPDAYTWAFQDEGYGPDTIAALQAIVEPRTHLRARDFLFRQGDPFTSVYAVCSGCFRSSTGGGSERRQVLRFYFPGEILGLTAIYPGTQPCDVMALQMSSVCRVPFAALNDIATRFPVVQRHLWRMLSRELGQANQRAGRFAADKRVAAFLLDLSERLAHYGAPLSVFRLPMSRAEIGSYLSITPETVSRVMHGLQRKGLIRTEARRVILRDKAALAHLARELRLIHRDVRFER